MSEATTSRQTTLRFATQSQALRYDKVGTTSGKYLTLNLLISRDGVERTSYMPGRPSRVICSAELGKDSREGQKCEIEYTLTRGSQRRARGGVLDTD